MILGAEEIIAVSAPRKDDVIASKGSIVHSSCQKQYTDKGATFQKWRAEKALEENTWRKRQWHLN